MPGPTELIIVLLIVLLLFGASRLPKLGRSVGQAQKEFKAGLSEGPSAEGPCPFCGAKVAAEAKFCPGCGKSTDAILAEKNKPTSRSA